MSQGFAVNTGPTGPQGPTVRALMMCAAYTPTATGADVGEVVVPYGPDGVTPVTWNIRRLVLRVGSAGGAPSVTVEKSTGSGVFSAITVGTVTLGSGAYEGSTTASLGSVTSGEKMRFNVVSLGSGATNWTVVAELSV